MAPLSAVQLTQLDNGWQDAPLAGATWAGMSGAPVVVVKVRQADQALKVPQLFCDRTRHV